MCRKESRLMQGLRLNEMTTSSLEDRQAIEFVL